MKKIETEECLRLKCNVLVKKKILPWVSVPSLFRHGPENHGPFLSRGKKMNDVMNEIQEFFFLIVVPSVLFLARKVQFGNAIQATSANGSKLNSAVKTLNSC